MKTNEYRTQHHHQLLNPSLANYIPLRNLHLLSCLIIIDTTPCTLNPQFISYHVNLSLKKKNLRLECMHIPQIQLSACLSVCYTMPCHVMPARIPNRLPASHITSFSFSENYKVKYVRNRPGPLESKRCFIWFTFCVLRLLFEEMAEEAV